VGHLTLPLTTSGQHFNITSATPLKEPKPWMINAPLDLLY
jgi:hypothetical protein